MERDPKDVRLPLMVSRPEADAIDDWRFANRIRTRAEAVRLLIRRGLDAGPLAAAMAPDTQDAPPGAECGGAIRKAP